MPEEVLEVLTQLKNVPEPQIKFDFWPNLGESSRIEPDVVIKFWQHRVSRENEPFLRIMLECKWDSSQSGDDQLWRQWNALSEVQQQRTLHVYLVKDASEGWEELSASAAAQRTSNQSQVWMQRAVVVMWAQLIRPEVLRLVGPLTGWLEDVSKLLSKLGILPFYGFSAIARETQAPPPPILFWHRFYGFGQVGLQTVSQSTPVFYQTRSGFHSLGTIAYIQTAAPVFWANATAADRTSS